MGEPDKLYFKIMGCNKISNKDNYRGLLGGGGIKISR